MVHQENVFLEVLREVLVFWRPEEADLILHNGYLQALQGGDCSEVYLLQSDYPICIKVVRQESVASFPGLLRAEALGYWLA